MLSARKQWARKSDTKGAMPQKKLFNYFSNKTNASIFLTSGNNFREYRNFLETITCRLAKCRCAKWLVLTSWLITMWFLPTKMQHFSSDIIFVLYRFVSGIAIHISLHWETSTLHHRYHTARGRWLWLFVALLLFELCRPVLLVLQHLRAVPQQSSQTCRILITIAQLSCTVTSHMT